VHLVQILLPLRDDKGRGFPKQHYDKVATVLTNRFGGVTAYTRTPAEGRWKEGGRPVSEDDVVVFEVMVERIEAGWWRTYRGSLERRFRQKNIIVRAQDIRIL
jgi:hypothetical protein